ncbi:MAG: hypothetical protein MPN21_23820 [Thermoanaerobaculia bacterium]|nr:hypothetical protein [Thermoanaerobaculia bacterium]
MEVALYVGCQGGHGLVTPLAISFDRLHHDPVEITGQRTTSLVEIDPATTGRQLTGSVVE